MPIYEYDCTACGAAFEKLHRTSDREKPVCPQCASRKVKRRISPAGFVLKGSGWYKTDYPSEARKKGVAADKSEGGSAKPDAKADAKPADSPPKPPEKKPAPPAKK
jgi:putative FmdB family regulatory protein